MEVNSFVSKFVSLWRSGQRAHLNLESHDGNAWVALRVQLGHAENLPDFHSQQGQHNQDQNFKKKQQVDTPCRQRRQEKRAAERELNKVIVKDSLVNEIDDRAEKAYDVSKSQDENSRDEVKKNDLLVMYENKGVENNDCVGNKEDEGNMKAEEASFNIEDEAEKLHADKTVEESNKGEKPDMNKGSNHIDKSAEDACNNDTNVSSSDSKEMREEKDKSNETENEVKTVEVNEIVQKVNNDVIKIYATCIIEKSPYDKQCDEDIETVYKIIGSKDHLAKNILDVKAFPCYSNRHRGKFQHFINLQLFVKTTYLWEEARSYIWKHLQ